MTPQDILNYWLSIRTEQTKDLLAKWSDANWEECAKEASILAALHQTVQDFVDSFKPQG